MGDGDPRHRAPRTPGAPLRRISPKSGLLTQKWTPDPLRSSVLGQVIEKHFIPLREKGTEWGVSIPYLIQVPRLDVPSTSHTVRGEGRGVSD